MKSLLRRKIGVVRAIGVLATLTLYAGCSSSNASDAEAKPIDPFNTFGYDSIELFETALAARSEEVFIDCLRTNGFDVPIDAVALERPVAPDESESAVSEYGFGISRPPPHLDMASVPDPSEQVFLWAEEAGLGEAEFAALDASMFGSAAEQSAAQEAMVADDDVAPTGCVGEIAQLEESVSDAVAPLFDEYYRNVDQEMRSERHLRVAEEFSDCLVSSGIDPALSPGDVIGRMVELSRTWTEDTDFFEFEKSVALTTFRCEATTSFGASVSVAEDIAIERTLTNLSEAEVASMQRALDDLLPSE